MILLTLARIAYFTALGAALWTVFGVLAGILQ